MNLDRAINLLASGIPAVQVASILGVSPSRIAQLSKEESFMLALRAKELELAEGDIEAVALDAKYHTAEHALVEQVINMAPIAELRDVTAALRVVAERRSAQKIHSNPIPVGGVVLNQVISLSLPPQILPSIAITGQNEIISIGNKNLAPMTSDGVIKLFNRKEEQNVLTRIPKTAETSIAENSTEEEQIVEKQHSFSF